MKVTTMRHVRAKTAIGLDLQVKQMEAQGWYKHGKESIAFDRIEGSVISQTMCFEGEKQCTHEFEIIGGKKLCYLCLHKEDI